MAIKAHFELTDNMPLEPLQPGKKSPVLRILNTIDFGHLLTMATFIAAMAVSWNAFDRRLTIVEEQNKQLIVQLIEQRQGSRDNIVEVKADVKTIKEAVGQMQIQMAVTESRLTTRK